MEWNESLAASVLELSTSRDAQFCELFCEFHETYEVIAENGLVQLAKSGVQAGIGVRVKTKELQWHVFSEDLSEKGCLKLANAARDFTSLQGGRKQPKNDPVENGLKNVHLISSLESDAKHLSEAVLSIANTVEKSAASLTNKLSLIRTGIYVNKRSFMVLSSSGNCAREENTRVSVSIRSQITQNNKTFTGSYLSSHLGMPDGKSEKYREAGQKAVQRALMAVDSRPAPAGVFPVVLAPGAGGLLFHEACGHALEGDMIERGSIFSGCIGDTIAADCITLADSSKVPEGWGSYGHDDEGQPGSHTVLIERGVLKNIMCDTSYAQKLQRPNSGNGRRASYKDLPIPRMTNTYLMPGAYEPEEIIRDTRHGIYACEFRGGQVNPVTGDFSFFVEEGFAIRDGKLAEPLQGATILGNGRYILKNIDKVGNDLKHFPASCIKAGQQVPVGIGQPTVKVKEMFVSGMAER